MDTLFVDVVLVDAGNNKIKVIQALREVSAKEKVLEMLDLSRAKRLAEATPCVVASNIPSEVGERVKLKLENAGATVELKAA